MKAHSNINDFAGDKSGERWDIQIFGIAHRSRLIAYAQFKFPTIPNHEVEEIVDRVIERAADPPGSPGAFPDAPLDEPGMFVHLRKCAHNACLNWQRDNRCDFVDTKVFATAGGTIESDGEMAVKLGEVLADAEQNLDPNTWAYVQMHVAGFERGDMRFTKRQVERMREKWSVWSIEAKRRVGALLPLPAFVRRWLEGGGGMAAAGAGGAALSTKIAAGCAAAVVCAAGVFGATKATQDTPSHSEAAKSSIAAPVVRETASLPRQKFSDNERKDTKKRNARTRQLARTEDGSAAEREFGVEQTATTESPSEVPVAQSGDGCEGSAAGEFSVDC